ncbi:hypothetical protein [Phycicoccus ginsengisoli]
MRPLVEGVDHVYVPMVGAEEAFEVLSADLGLPVLWPFTSFGAFASGGLSVGSTKLEVIGATDAAPWCTAQILPQIQGVALRPAAPVDAAYLRSVDASGLARSEPALFERDGRPAWTNLYLTDVIGERAGAFVCDYHLPESKDLGRRRRVLADCGGGLAGCPGRRRAGGPGPRPGAGGGPVAAAPRPASDRRAGLAPGRRAGGPARGDEDRVERLDLAVRSVVRAREVWAERAAQRLPGFPLGFVPGEQGGPPHRGTAGPPD